MAQSQPSGVDLMAGGESWSSIDGIYMLTKQGCQHIEMHLPIYISMDTDGLDPHEHHQFLCYDIS